MKKQYLTINQAAQRLGISAKTLRRWEEKGILTPKRSIGNQRRYLLSDIEKREKKAFTINEAAARLYISANTLRRWEEKGILTPKRSIGNQRLYTLADIKKLEALHYPTVDKKVPTNNPDPVSIDQIPSENPDKPRFFDVASLEEKQEQQKEAITSRKETLSPVVLDEINPIVDRPFHAPISIVNEAKEKETKKHNHEKYLYFFAKKPVQYGFALSSVVGIIILLAFVNKITDSGVLLSSLPFLSNTNTTKNSKVGTGNEVLATETQKYDYGLKVSVPAEFFSTASVSGKLTAPNVLYSVVAGDNITISGDAQNPIISANASGVTSIGGATGAIALVAGNGVSVDGLTITNTDQGSSQHIFGNIKVGSDTISAGSNTDTFELAAGGNISLSTDTSNKKITISAGSGSSGIDGIEVLEGGTTIANTITGLNFLGGDFDVGTSPPGQATIQLANTLTSVTGVTGNFAIGGNLTVGSDTINDFSGNGLSVTSNALGVNLTTSGGTSTTSSNSGLEVGASGLSLLKGCADGELLKWDNTNKLWMCSADAGAGGSGIATVKSNDTVVGSAFDTIDFSSLFSVSDSPSNEANVDIANDSIGDTQLAFNTGQNLTTSSSPTFSSLTLSSLTLGSTITNIAGAGLQVVGGALETTLGTSVDLTSEVTGILPLARGGTGLNINSATITDGQILIGNDGADGFSLATLTAGSGITITNGSGAIAIAQTASGISKFTQDNTNGVLYPNISTLDFLVGGTSTASAKFSVLNVANGTPIASISAGTPGAMFISANGSLQTTNKQSLTLGGGNTGNVVVSGIGTGVVHSTNGVLSSSDVLLGTETSGNYVATITGNSQISVSGSGSENAAVSLSINADSIGDSQLAFDTGQNLTTTSSPTFNGLSLTSLTMAGDTITDLTGTGLQVVGNALQTTLGVSVDLTSEVTGILGVANGGTNKALSLSNGGIVYSDADSLEILNANANAGLALVSGGAAAPSWFTPTQGSLIFAGANGALSQDNASLFFDDSNNRFGIGVNSNLLGALDVRATSGTLPVATLSGRTSFATLTVDNTLGDLFTASASGLSRFTISNNGSLYTNGIQGQTVATASCVTTTNGIVTGTANCNTPPSIFLWGTSSDNKAIIQGNTTQDLLLGGTATTSAKFAVLNVAGTNPVASLSGQTGGLFLTANGQLQTTNKQPLTLGGGDTGNIVLPILGTGVVQATNGVLSVSSIDLATDVSGILPLNHGGTNKNLTPSNGGIVWTDTDSMEVLSANTNTGLALVSGGASTPSWFAPSQGSVIFAGANGALSSDNINLFFDDATNRLGVGTNIPRAALDVAGTASFSGNVTFHDGASSIQASSNNTLTLGGDTTGDVILRPLDGQTGSNVIMDTNILTLLGTGTINATSLANINTNTVSLNTTVSDLTLDSAGDINLDADGSDILFKDGGTTFATMSNLSTDLLIDAVGNNVILASGDTLNVGSGTGAAYNSFATSLTNVDLANNPDDLFIGGALEVNGNTRIDGSTIIFSAFANCTALTTTSGNIGCSTTPVGSNWDIVNGTITPKLSSALDLLIGGVSSSSARFHAYGSVNAGTTPAASISASSTFAGLVVNNTVGDLFTASSSGQTRFVIANNGNIQITNLTTGVIHANTTGILSSSDLNLATETTGILPIGNGGSPFEQNAGSIFQRITTQDVLFGGTATTSAKFAFINNGNGGTPVASIGGTIALSANGSLQTISYNTLSLGGSSTGDISISPKAGTGTLALNANTLTINGSTGATSPSLTCVSVTNGIVTGFGGCGAGAGGSKWYVGDPSGVLYPQNPTLDLLIGGSTTASAKFAILNVAGGTPTASLSAQSDGGALVLTPNSLTTQNAQALTIGGGNTGDLFLNTGTKNLLINGTPGVTIGTANCVTTANGIVIGQSTCPSAAANFIWQTGNGTIFEGNTTQDLLIGGVATNSARFHVFGSAAFAGTTPVASISGNTSQAGLIVDNRVGDLFTASASGQTRFVIANNGNIGIGTSTPSEKLSLVGNIQFLDNYANLYGTNLKIWGNNNSNLYLQDPLSSTGRVGIGLNTNNSPLATLDIRGNSGTIPAASTSANSSFASLIVDNSGSGDIFTASSAGRTRFTINQNGTLTVPVYAGNNALLYANATTGQIIPLTTGSSNQCLISGTSTPSWSSCAAAGSNWDITAGTISPKLASVLDFLIGGAATTSAKFAVLNVNGTAIPVASLSATNNGGNGIVLNANGSIQSLRDNTLTLGGDTTGNIILNPRNGATGGFIAPATDNVTDLGSSSSARFRSVYLGPGSLHVQCTNGDGCAQGTDYAFGINTTTGDLEIGINGNISNKNAKIKLGQNGTTTFTNDTLGTNFFASDGTNFAGIYGSGALEIARSTNDAYIDLKTSNAEDYDVRLEANSNGFGVRTGGSGSRSFFVDATGNLYFYNYDCSTNANGGTLTVDASHLVSCADDDGSAGAGQSKWTQDNTAGILTPNISTLDLLIGGTSSASATFHLFGAAKAGTNPVASIAANTSFAALVVNNKGKGDLFTASSSGLNRFVIKQNGNIGIGVANPQANVEIVNTLNAATAGIGNLSILLRNNSTTNGTGPGIGFVTSTTGDTHVGAKIDFLRTGSNSQGDLAFYTKGDTGTGDTTSQVLRLSATNGSPTATISANTSQTGLVVDNKGTGNLFDAKSNGLNRFTILQNGNVGIGTTAPTYALDIAGTGNGIIIEDNGRTPGDKLLAIGDDTYFTDVDAGNTVGLYGVQDSTVGSLKLGSAGQTISGYSGKIGINNTAPSSLLTVTGGAIGGTYGLIPSYASWNAYGVGDGGVGIYNDHSSFNTLMIVGSNVAGGDRTIGLWDTVKINGSSGYPLWVDQTNGGAAGIRVQIHTTGSPGNFMLFQSINGNGTDYTNGWIAGCCGGGTSYNSASDIRLKENIADTHYGIDDLMKVRVADFNYINNPNDRTTGFLAQQLYGIYPPAVTVGTSGDDLSIPWGVDYGKITPLIIKSVQDQQGQIETLKQQVSDMIAGSLDTDSLTVNNLQTQTLTLGGTNVNDKLIGLDQSASTSATLGIQIADMQSQMQSLSNRVASVEGTLAALTASNSALFMNSPLWNFTASTGAELSLDKLNVNGSIIADSLNVLSYATINELSVTGSIRTGVLTINGQSNDGASISTLNGDLRLQDQGFGGIDILNGLVTIDTSGNIQTEGTITAKKLNIDETDTLSASVGQGTIPLNGTNVIINTTAVTNDSHIFVTPRTKISLPLSVTTQTAGSSFKVEINSPATQAIKFDWWIVN